jgi:hypothetical protein
MYSLDSYKLQHRERYKGKEQDFNQTRTVGKMALIPWSKRLSFD